MRLGNPVSSFVELEAARERYSGGRAGTEVWVTVKVVAGTFGSATGGGFVTRPDWQRFLEHLAGLEASRKGEASLGSADSREFALRIYASGASGHMAVEGTLRSPEATERAEFRFAGIQFEPSVLPTLLRELREAAA